MPRARATTTPAQSPQDRTAQGLLRLEYAGRWVAWTEDERRIIAAGATPEEVRAAAERAGHTRFIYDWVPPAHERQVGGVRA